MTHAAEPLVVNGFRCGADDTEECDFRTTDLDALVAHLDTDHGGSQ